MALDLSISHGQRPSTTTHADEVTPLTRALSLAHSLAEVLADTRGFGVHATAQHELSLAHSLASHIVDILTSLPPSSVRTRTPGGDADQDGGPASIARR